MNFIPLFHRERERERNQISERDRQTDRQTDRKRDRNRRTGRETGKREERGGPALNPLYVRESERGGSLGRQADRRRIEKDRQTDIRQRGQGLALNAAKINR